MLKKKLIHFKSLHSFVFFGFSPSTLLCKSIAETMPTWHNPPDAKDSDSWKQHLRVLLYEKACLSYATLAEHEFTCNK